MIPISSFAYDQYESMNVGETKTFYFPSEVTNRASTMYAYNCSSDRINNVEVISYTNTSVTVKAVAYTQSQVNIRFDYWWYENSYGRHDTHMVHIDLNGGGGGGGNTGSDYNPSNYDIDYGSWGTITVDEGKTTTVYCQYDIPNPSKVRSILWSDYNQFSYEITSQNSSSCTIKGRIASSGGKLWCLMKYGSNSYKAYYTVVVKESTTPTLSLSADPAGGVIDTGTKVYLTASNSSADIYYTLNGSQPTTSSSKYTSTGITINETCTLKAFARKSGYNDSPIMTWIFTAQSSGIKVTNITLNMTSLFLKPGQEETLMATVKPDDATNKKVTWSSDKTNVATIDDNGIVKAVAVGNATITCKANDGSGVQAICDVSVKPEGIDINATNFPDENFRNYLLSQSYGQDGVITESEINDVRSLALDNKNISSLKGIEFFTKLNSLYCENNQLTSLDVSKITSLTLLWCAGNQLTSIDVSKNIALKDLSCDKNQLISLNLSKNTALEYLYCYKNHLTSLDVSNNLALIRLVCWSNQLTTLDVSHNTALDYLYCGYNQLTSLDVSHNTALTVLRFNNNQIKGVAMDNLISSLPMNTTEFVYNFEVIDPANESEDNICTTIQVAAVKAKGWFPCYWDVSAQEYKEYEGSEEIKPESISLPRTYTITAGQTITLTPEITPADAKTTLTWTSDDKGIALVDANGVVTGIKKGQTFINVETENGKTAYCKLTVTEPDPSGISNVQMDDETVKSVFTLSGQRLAAPKKGINIIGGKKVVIRSTMPLGSPKK